MTRIVNIHKEPYDVYIGRAGKGQDGYFGNPIKRGCQCPLCLETHEQAGDTIPCYEAYFRSRMKKDAEFRRKILALKDKTLGCFCKPGPCHGDVIVEYLDGKTLEMPEVQS